jgi:hypothetical protein
MKRIFAAVLCLICLLSISGCKPFLTDPEQVIYSKTVKEFLTALDHQDSDALYCLFSVAVQEERQDLKEKIEELLLIYPGPTDQIGNISSLAGESAQEMGREYRNAFTVFPVLSEGKYYWVYLDLMYENTFDKDQIGITQINFYTADAYCAIWSGAEQLEDHKGINLFVENRDNYNVISINNYPYDFHPAKVLNLEEVTAFLETSPSMTAFINRFGEPAAADEFGFVYDLPKEKDGNRYLYLGCEGDLIIYAQVLSDFYYVDTILEE